MGLAAATHGQIVTWNGGGDGVNWNDPLNWSGAQTPGPTNDVVISVAPNATIVCASGATIQSVQCTGGFFVVSGTLTVTEGASTISGPLTMAPQAGLSGSGVGVSFTATGPTQVDDARLYVSSGALLALPKVGACQSWDSTWWQASGAGSRLVLAGLTNAVCGSGDWHHVWAQNGGRIELEALTTLGDGYLEVLADGLESLVDLTSLTAYNAGGTHYGSMQARNGGTILTPQLALARGWALTLGAAGVLTLPALTNFDGGSLSVASGLTMALPGLTRWQGGALGLDGTATVSAPGLTNIDNVSLYATDGAVLALPNVQTYQSWDRTIWQANGTGSRVVLADLTNAVAGSGDWHYMQALGGGRMELGALTTLGDGYVDVLANGTNSVVDLTSLAAYNAGGTHYGNLQARNGGAVLVPQLALARRWALTLGTAGVLTLPALTNFDGGSLSVASGMTLALPGLTRWQGGGLGLDGSATLSVPDLTNLDDVSLYASGGAVLALPNVRTYQSWDRTVWQATGAGSRVVLAALTNAVCGSGDWHYLQALNGGRMEMGALMVLGDGYLDVLADGADSVVDLSGLTAYNAGGTHYGSMQARNGGAILTLQLALVHNLAITLGAAGVLTLPAVTNFDGGSLSLASGMTMAVPGLTHWQGGGLGLDGSASLSAPGLTNMDNVSLYATGGAVLALPKVETYQSWDRTVWQAIGAGSRVVLTGLTNALCGANDWHYLQALNGGRVELGALAVLGDGYTDILADGVDSVVDLGGWRLWTGTRYLNLTARNSGFLDLHTLPSFSSGLVQVLADGAGSVIDLSSLSSFSTRNGLSSLTGQNGGTILFYRDAFLLANVVVNLSSGSSGTLPPVLTGGNALTLYGAPGRSYWVERLNPCDRQGTWQFSTRVPLTNAFQVFAPSPRPCETFRVWEFVADPPMLDLFHADGEVQLVLYGQTNRTFQLETTESLEPTSESWAPWNSTGVMTNTFHIFPNFPAAAAKRFFRGKQL